MACPPHSSGNYFYPFDCTKYFKCQQGKTLVESCANGSVFSINRRKCISRDQVGAYDRVEYYTNTQHEFSNENVYDSGKLLKLPKAMIYF